MNGRHDVDFQVSISTVLATLAGTCEAMCKSPSGPKSTESLLRALNAGAWRFAAAYVASIDIQEPRWTATARRVSAAAADIEDACQAGLVNAFTFAERMGASGAIFNIENLDAWVHACIRNAALEINRKEATHRDYLTNWAIHNPAAQIVFAITSPTDAIQDQQTMQSIVHDLINAVQEPKYREIFRLRSSGCSNAEVAGRVHLSESRTSAIFGQIKADLSRRFTVVDGRLQPREARCNVPSKRPGCMPTKATEKTSLT